MPYTGSYGAELSALLRILKVRLATCTHMANAVSVVVPAFDEAPNIRPLTERLFAATRAAGLEVELLIVDDESPGSAATKAIACKLASEEYAVQVHARQRADGRGLSSAVLLGFAVAKYTTVLCMDADLQHEPESVPALAVPVLRGTADFVVGSRHVTHGGLGFQWSMLRQLISTAATLLARPLTPSTDPMSGFFCLNQAT